MLENLNRLGQKASSQALRPREEGTLKAEPRGAGVQGLGHLA